MDTHDDRRRTLVLAALASLAAAAPGETDAQDPAKVAPFAFRTALENDKLRVLEFSSRPGAGICGVGRHSHPEHLVVALTDAKVRVTLPDGRRIEVENKAGDVFWAEAETHTTENIGGRAARALIVELKAPRRA
jgi:quercetin dioxygenase-like cupin family protein